LVVRRVAVYIQTTAMIRLSHANAYLGSAGRELDDDGSVVLTGGLETSIDTRGGDAIDSRNSVTYTIGQRER
jgi:hypothetical protein